MNWIYKKVLQLKIWIMKFNQQIHVPRDFDESENGEYPEDQLIPIEM